MLATSSGQGVISVFVIEPQALMAKAICQLLSEDSEFAVAGSAQSLETGRLRGLRPELIVLDADDAIAELTNLIAECKAAAPDARVCVFSEFLNSDVLLRALSAGADGYVMKDISPPDMVSAMKAIGHGTFYADPRLSSVVLRQRAQRKERSITELSPRETEVVRLIAQGLSNKEISQRLMLSDKTVKNHISSIFSKLRMTARTQVAIHAIRSGFA